MSKDCPFCARRDEGEFQALSRLIMFFEPLNPVTPGHTLFMPFQHVEHRNLVSGDVVGRAMKDAATYAHLMSDGNFNLITSSGPNATQTVDHIHVHYVPRREGDGLSLPWTGQKK